MLSTEGQQRQDNNVILCLRGFRHSGSVNIFFYFSHCSTVQTVRAYQSAISHHDGLNPGRSLSRSQLSSNDSDMVGIF